jgi:hypothetical protein
VQSGYKKVFGSIEQYRTKSSFETPTSGYELWSRGIELSLVFGIGGYRIMARKELYYEKKTSFVI